jgi:hypothetical protein
MSDFANGLLHPVLTVEHVLALTGAALWAGQAGAKPARGLLTGLLAGGAAGAIAGWCGLLLNDGLVRWLLLLGMALTGGLAAARWHGRQVLFPAIGLLVASAIAWQTVIGQSATTLPLVFAGGILGGLVAVGVLVAGLARQLDAGAPWQRVAVRVAGSWLLAIGILMLALPAR